LLKSPLTTFDCYKQNQVGEFKKKQNEVTSQSLKELWKDPVYRAKLEIWSRYQDDILAELYVKYFNPSTNEVLWDLAMKDPLYLSLPDLHKAPVREDQGRHKWKCRAASRIAGMKSNPMRGGDAKYWVNLLEKKTKEIGS
jgi:hypothetical protein